MLSCTDLHRKTLRTNDKASRAEDSPPSCTSSTLGVGAGDVQGQTATTHHRELFLATRAVLKVANRGFGEVVLPHLRQCTIRILFIVLVVIVVALLGFLLGLGLLLSFFLCFLRDLRLLSLLRRLLFFWFVQIIRGIVLLSHVRRSARVWSRRRT